MQPPDLATLIAELTDVPSLAALASAMPRRLVDSVECVSGEWESLKAEAEAAARQARALAQDLGKRLSSAAEECRVRGDQLDAYADVFDKELGLADAGAVAAAEALLARRIESDPGAWVWLGTGGCSDLLRLRDELDGAACWMSAPPGFVAGEVASSAVSSCNKITLGALDACGEAVDLRDTDVWVLVKGGSVYAGQVEFADTNGPGLKAGTAVWAASLSVPCGTLSVSLSAWVFGHPVGGSPLLLKVRYCFSHGQCH